MIEPASVLSYVLALAIAVAIPGPGITALVARTVTGGVRGGYALWAGLALGDLVFLSFAVFGLALVASQFAAVFVVIKWFSIVYLCFLGWQFWYATQSANQSANQLDSTVINSTCDHSSEQTADAIGKPDTGFSLAGSLLSGLLLTLGNPKPIAFYLALLPLILDLEQVSFDTWAFVLVPLTLAVLFVIGSLFILAAASVRHLLASEKAQRLLHRVAAIAMVGAAITMVVRE